MTHSILNDIIENGNNVTTTCRSELHTAMHDKNKIQ